MATKEEIQAAILHVINDCGPLKGTELITKIMTEILFEDFSEYVVALSELISRREVLELEYVLPHMSYRTKSMYFPKHTHIKAVTHEDLNCSTSQDQTQQS